MQKEETPIAGVEPYFDLTWNPQWPNGATIPPKKAGVTRIAAVGASCVAGYPYSKAETTMEEKRQCYPAYLKEMLGSEKYEVLNFGMSRCALQKSYEGFEAPSYWDTKAFEMAKKSSPDMVFILLGTNDAKGNNWNEERFVADYADMVKIFQSLDSKPTVYMISTTPFVEKYRAYDEKFCDTCNKTYPPLQKQMA